MFSSFGLTALLTSFLTKRFIVSILILKELLYCTFCNKWRNIYSFIVLIWDCKVKALISIYQIFNANFLLFFQTL
jgi:hypothetical protein